MVPLESLPELPAPLPLMLAAAARPLRFRSPNFSAFGFTVEQVRISTEHLDHYAHLVGGCPGGGVPLAYPFVMAAPLHLQIISDKRFPFAAMGLVHLHQRIERVGHLEKRLPLDIDAFVQNARFRERTATFTIETRVHQASRLLWQGSTRVLARLGQRGATTTPAPDAKPLPEGHQGGPREALDASEVIEGGPPTEIEVERWRLEGDLGFRYSRVAGDLNPIHLHRFVSRPFGFERPIIHGMWTFARALSTLDSGTGPAVAQIGFEKPIYLPGEACLRVTPPGRERSFSVWSADGRTRHAHGTATLRG